MALTKPKIWDLDTNLMYFMDPITVLHQGATSATVDVGFLFNRANGLVSNVAMYWSESAQSFNYVFTNDAGVTNSNVSPSNYANVQIGSLMMVNGAGIYVGGNIGIPGSVMTSTGTGVIWAPSGGFTGGQLTLPLSIANLTPATSSTSGAFYVTGGVGFGSNAYFNTGSTGQILTPVVGSTTNAAIYSQGITPSSTNYTLSHNGAYTSLNSNTAVMTAIAGVPVTTTVSGIFNVYGKLNMYGNIIPAANVTYDIGSSTNRFRDLYLAGTTIDLAGATLSATNGTITLKNALGGSFSVSGSVPGQSTGTFGNLVANSGIASTSTTTGALQVTGGAGVSGSVYAASMYGTAVYDNSNRVLTNLSSSGAGNLTVSVSAPASTTIALPATGPGAVTVGSSTAIPVITTDAYGRISALTSSAVSTTINLAGTSGTGSVAGGGTLTFASGNGVTATVSSSTITIGTPQDVRTSASPSFAGGTYTGTLTTQTHIPSANVTYNLGSTTAWWNMVYGKAMQAQYADLAENYTADCDYAPGTVVVFGGTAEITVTTVDHNPAVAGVISTDPAYLMNSVAGGLPVALQGRVPCRVQGPVEKGQVLVTSNVPGVAQAIDNSKFVPGCVIGKALNTINSNNIETIEVVVGKH